MKRQHEWTPEERETAYKLHESGLSWREVGEELGRSKSSVISAVARYEGREWTLRSTEYFDGPPIGLTLECQRIKNDAKDGSKALAEAINSLRNRTPMRVLRFVEGTPCLVEPGQERVRKTSEIERLAA